MHQKPPTGAGHQPPPPPLWGECQRTDRSITLAPTSAANSVDFFLYNKNNNHHIFPALPCNAQWSHFKYYTNMFYNKQTYFEVMFKGGAASLCYIYHILFILYSVWVHRGLHSVHSVIKYPYFFTYLSAHILKFFHMQKQNKDKHKFVCIYTTSARQDVYV